MRSLLSALFFFVTAAAPVAASAAAGEPAEATHPAISQSHHTAAKSLLLTSDPGGFFAKWSDDSLKAIFNGAIDAPAAGSWEERMLQTAIDLGGQAREKILNVHATLIARHMSEADILAVAAMYADGKSEKSILKTKPGKKWREARMETAQLRQDIVTVMTDQWQKALTKAAAKL